MNKKFQYLVYDARYHTNPDSATIFCCCNSLKEAKNDRKDYGSDCVIEENEIQPDGKTLISTGKIW